MSAKAATRRSGGTIDDDHQEAKRAKLFQDVVIKDEVDSPLMRYASASVGIKHDIDDENSILSDKNKLDVALIFKSLQGGKMDLDIFSGLGQGPADVSSFTTEQTMTLIECVKEQPALWDPSSGVSQKTKRDTWSIISQMMESKGHNIDSRLCCSKFRILRDSYMRIIRKSAAKGTSAQEKGKSWQFFDHLRFLGDGNGGTLPNNNDDRSASSPEVEPMPEQIEIQQQSYNDILMKSIEDEAARVAEEKARKAQLAAAAALTAAALAAIPKMKEESPRINKPSSITSSSSDRNVEAPFNIGKMRALPQHLPNTSSIIPTVIPSTIASTPVMSQVPKKLCTVAPDTKPMTPATSSTHLPTTTAGSSRIIDTWSSFGDHVSDVLREMSRLEEDDAWDMRFAIDNLLLERSQKLRERVRKVIKKE